MLANAPWEINFNFQPSSKKPRITSMLARTPRNCAAPIARMVKHIEPWFDARFIDDSYANRKGKDTQAAILRLQHFMRQPGHRWNCKIDIQTRKVNRIMCAN